MRVVLDLVVITFMVGLLIGLVGSTIIHTWIYTEAEQEDRARIGGYNLGLITCLGDVEPSYPDNMGWLTECEARNDKADRFNELLEEWT